MRGVINSKNMARVVVKKARRVQRRRSEPRYLFGEIGRDGRVKDDERREFASDIQGVTLDVECTPLRDRGGRDKIIDIGHLGSQMSENALKLTRNFQSVTSP